MNETCENCRFRRGSFCMRYPPQVNAPQVVHSDRAEYIFETRFPEVGLNEWCGEHEYIQTELNDCDHQDR